VEKRLSKMFSLNPDREDVYRLSLAESGRAPGDYTSKFRITLQAEQRADAATKQVLAELFAAMQANEAGAIAALDSEFLHDFRVAVRRTRSALSGLRHVFTPAMRKRFQREFAWLGGLTSTQRDLDVYLLKFESYKRSLPTAIRDDLEPLREFLRFKQQRERAEVLATGLRSARYRKLKAQWQRYLESDLPKRPTARDAGRTITDLASTAGWRMYRRVMREGAAINDESLPEELHELRKSCKKLRYLLEFFRSIYTPGVVGTVIRELKLLQDNLGDFQDLEVQIHRLEAFSMEMRRRGEYSAATGKAMNELLRVLQQNMAAVRKEFADRFSRFSARENRKAFRAALHVGPEEDSTA